MPHDWQVASAALARLPAKQGAAEDMGERQARRQVQHGDGGPQAVPQARDAPLATLSVSLTSSAASRTQARTTIKQRVGMDVWRTIQKVALFDDGARVHVLKQHLGV